MPRLIVGLGSGAVADVPAVAMTAIADAGPGAVHGPPMPEELTACLGVAVAPYDPTTCPADAIVVAPDPAAVAIAADLPDTPTLPDRDALRARAIGAGVARLAQVGLELRERCPWDREQVPETILPHTVEEAFEVAEAFASGESARQVDEIGDLLFQAVFLSRFLEEAGIADLGEVARIQADKLVSRHPHVYGDAVAAEAGAVFGLWESQKRASRGGEIFHEVPAGLPALAYSAKLQKRAGAVGFQFPDVDSALAKLTEEVGELTREPSADELGDVIFAAIAVARALGVDAELAVRRSSATFRDRVDRASEIAAARGEVFEKLAPDVQLRYYRAAKADLAGDSTVV